MQTSNQTYGAGESYDILHKNKDYEKEVDYLQECFNKYTKNVNTVLDVGCGTGGHSTILHKRGINQLGIDPCPVMINIAKKKPGAYKCISLEKLSPSFGSYDAVISMFNVVNHIDNIKDLQLYFKSIYSQLNFNGLFIFDCFNNIAFNRDTPKILKKQLFTITPIVNYFQAQMELVGKSNISSKMNYNIKQRIWGIDILSDYLYYNNFKEIRIFKQNTHKQALIDDYKITIICKK